MLRGCASTGCSLCIKHFHGHGSALGDSHVGFVDVSDTWTPQELEPFVAMIEAERCDLVMTAHLF